MIGTEDDLSLLLADKRELLAFRVADTDFGLPVSKLREVVPMVAITRLHGYSGESDGVINYRGVVIPVVALRGALGLPPVAPSLDHYILVTEAKGQITGWLVDDVSDVVHVHDRHIDAPGTRTPLRNVLGGVAKLEDRLLPLLDLDALGSREQPPQPAALLEEIDPAIDRVLQARARELSTPVEHTEVGGGELSTFVRFVLGGSLCAVSAESVKEIVVPPTITPIPGSAHHTYGIVNVRGVLLVVIGLSAFLRFGENETQREPTENRGARLVVVEVDGVGVGFWVDHVLDVCDVSPHDLGPPPMGLSGSAAPFVEAEFDWDDHPVCVINVAAVLSAMDSRADDPISHGPAGP